MDEGQLKMKIAFYIAMVIIGTLSPAYGDNFAQEATRPVAQALEIRQGTQKVLDDWGDEKSRLVARFKTLEMQNKGYEKAKAHLEEQVTALRQDIEVLEQDRKNIQTVSEGLQPLLEETWQRLESSIQNSLPFLPEERQERAASLKEIVWDDSVSLGEKFRRTAEVLQIESEFGSTVETYQKRILLDQEERLVNILRLGRMSLFFQTLDRDFTGVYDPATASWITLPNGYETVISQAMDMEAKRCPTDILMIPLGKVAAQ